MNWIASCWRLRAAGVIPTIVSIHSVVVEGNTVSIGYDLKSRLRTDEQLFFEFERPSEVGKDAVGAFAAWLAWSHCGTVH